MSLPESPIFDQAHYVRISEARAALLRDVLPQIREQLSLQSALDTGCGVGYFSELLQQLRFEVSGFDGRDENIREAQSRYPEIQFWKGDVEDSTIQQLGSFDLVLCLGLLYHLENPFRAVRNLHALTGKLLILESMCLPDSETTMLMRDEGAGEDQALRRVAFYPSEACFIKMCKCAGFPFVYRFAALPDHEDFRSSAWHKQRRTMLAASKSSLTLPFLLPVLERVSIDPWVTALGRLRWYAGRVARFVRKPWSDKRRSLLLRWVRHVPAIPVPVRLPHGAWWLARNDFCGAAILSGGFEDSERRFVERFLRPEMSVLDIGAHHGFYTLLASRLVGPRGRVVAFEPSLRERQRLSQHVRLNGCTNVKVEATALGDQEGEAEFFQVQGYETGCNSLRPPAVSESTKVLHVPVIRLESFLWREQMASVDFVKLDVEGAELGVLRGAGSLLEQQPRPVILAEVQNIRTRPWGYAAKEIVEFLSRRGFSWFQPLETGELRLVDIQREELDGSFVALPQERLADLRRLIHSEQSTVAQV